MSDLSNVSTDDLRRALNARGHGTCPSCRKWTARVRPYDADGNVLRCAGCLKAVSKCHC